MRSFLSMHRAAITIVFAASVIGFVPISRPAMAHHSSAMFDKSLVRQESATVREFQWTNPHVWIQVYIDNESGEQEEWSIEGGGPNSLFRKGWRPNSFNHAELLARDGEYAAMWTKQQEAREYESKLKACRV